MRSRCSLLSVKWNSDDSGTSFQCSAKLIRCAKSCKMLCFSPGRNGTGSDRDRHIPRYCSSCKMRVGRFQRYVCDILTTFFIFETLQMNVISLQDV